MNSMKKALLILGILLIIILAILYLFKSERNKEKEIFEFTPQEEVSKEDMRNTIVTLFFQNKNDKQLQVEARMIDSKELLKEPYKELLILLIEGPKNEQLESVIPNDTKINSISYDNGIVVIDLSSEFILADKEKVSEDNMIYSIVNTLTELKEVKGVKFLIDGNDNIKQDNWKTDLRNTFERKKSI